MGNEGSYAALGLKVWKTQIDRADKLLELSRPRRSCGNSAWQEHEHSLVYGCGIPHK